MQIPTNSGSGDAVLLPCRCPKGPPWPLAADPGRQGFLWLLRQIWQLRSLEALAYDLALSVISSKRYIQCLTAVLNIYSLPSSTKWRRRSNFQEFLFQIPRKKCVCHSIFTSYKTPQCYKVFVTVKNMQNACSFSKGTTVNMLGRNKWRIMYLHYLHFMRIS